MTCNFDKDELILKVLDGVATPEEILMLSRWMEEDPANEVYFNQLKKAWNVMSGPLPSKEIVDKIAAAGIVGLGGATFPTQVKLMPPPGSKAEIIIINAVECEPYLTSDHSLMMEKAEQILVGVTLLMKAVNVTKAVIGIENNKPDAIAHLSKLATAYKGIEIMPLKVQYPQGGEKQLIDAVIRRQVKSGALPISAGAVVQNVGTAFAVYEAVMKNKPLFERVVTVTGKAVTNPSNFLVRMGTPISALIEAAGGVPENTGKIIGGGPMMGKALIAPEVPVTKGSSGVLLLTKEESVRKPMRDCIRCATVSYTHLTLPTNSRV